jgi:hypothetical protein
MGQLQFSQFEHTLLLTLLALAATTWIMMWVLANAMVKDMTRKLDLIIERLHPR